MSNPKKPADDVRKNLSEPGSSPGNNSKSVTPKDVSAKDASARDVTERKIQSADPEERQEEQLDDAVEMTFPASDPIAIPVPEEELQRRKATGHRA